MTLKGFIYIPAFLSKKEEKQIINRLSKASWKEVKMYGVIAKRQVIHYGLDYTYNSRTAKPTISPPPFIISLINKSAPLLKIKPSEIVETLITSYPVGAGIGWHKDARIFGNKIFGISLGSDCVIKFRKLIEDKYEIIKITLETGSAYILSDDARWEWQHSISPMPKPRYSITFRTKNSE